MSYPAKGRADYLQLGDWNAACAQCGRKRKASTMLKLPPGVDGAGLFVCPEHWDYRQPQDYVRGIPDKQNPPWVQPETNVYAADFIVAEIGDDSIGYDYIVTETDNQLMITEGN